MSKFVNMLKKDLYVPDEGWAGASPVDLGREAPAENHEVAFVEGGVHAGFPSPAQDYLNDSIDLNRELVKHPAATFFARMVGDSMVEGGVEEGDILVVDKSLEPSEGDMAVCFIDGDFTLRYISYKNPADADQSGKRPVRKARKQGFSYDILEHRRMWLLSANEKYPPIEVNDANDFTIWGVVTYVIKKVTHHA